MNEAVRNERRKWQTKLKKEKLQHKLALERERLKTRECRASARAMKVISERVKQLKSNKRKDLLDKLGSPAKFGRARVTTHMAKFFGLTAKTVARTKKGRTNQKKRIAHLTLKVLTFMQDPQWSITYPGKKDLVCCRYIRFEDGKRVVWRRHLPKVVLTENLAELHKVYNRQNPKDRVCLTFFQDVRRRSQFIKTLNHAKAEVCLCQKHQNFALKMRAIYKHAKLPTAPDTLIRNVPFDEFKEKLKTCLPHLPDKIYYEEWKLAPITIEVKKVNHF